MLCHAVLCCAVLQADLLPVCRELGIGVLAYSPLGRGLLTGELQHCITWLPLSRCTATTAPFSLPSPSLA
jgi:aryl-alcohol dehydrogenase-like predicted oxidoreductase